jgi:uncharacterized protein (DUF736 family)
MFVNVCGLWKNTSKSGKEYWSGRLGDCNVMIFANDKKGNEKAPDYRLVIGERKNQVNNKQTDAPSGVENPFNDQDIPF